MIRVGLIDDHAMVRDALGHILDDSDLVNVVGTASDCASARDLVATAKPDVVVLDYGLPDGSALELIEAWCLLPSPPGIVVLTVHESPHYAVRALEAGALGFVIKASAFDELIQGVRAASAGEMYVSPAIASSVLAQLSKPRKERLGIGALSPRELELLRLLAQGQGILEAATTQNISTSTVSTYRARLLEKLGLRNTAELIRFALENDIQ
jgi:two-component system, NarL family, invasion response regulator UvrY